MDDTQKQQQEQQQQTTTPTLLIVPCSLLTYTMPHCENCDCYLASENAILEHVEKEHGVHCRLGKPHEAYCVDCHMVSNGGLCCGCLCVNVLKRLTWFDDLSTHSTVERNITARAL